MPLVWRRDDEGFVDADVAARRACVNDWSSDPRIRTLVRARSRQLPMIQRSNAPVIADLVATPEMQPGDPNLFASCARGHGHFSHVVSGRESKGMGGRHR